ncbi:MAG: sugar phosphate nucleotidyltransferase [Chloroflexota bacterium]|nr:sugar phosphate nucleotidyltransferase [Chloroflexota bacterium]
MTSRPARSSRSHASGTPRFWAIVPAGGSGTRLWPLSRAARPKFLLTLTGKRSLLQQTVDRLAPLAGPERTLVVCGPAHAAPVARQLPELPEANIIVEPAPRGSAPAIALATALIARREPDAIVGSFAADHEVADPAAFNRAIETAIVAAQHGWLVTVGLEPTRPETGYGYIERTTDVVAQTDQGTAYRSARFVEKPDLETAIAYLEAGRSLWNASMFVWQASTLLDEIARLQPELFTAVTRIAAAWGSPEQEQVTAMVWAELAESTIDQGILEHAERVAVVPASMGWSDVGDWNNLGDLIEQDGAGNRVRGDLLQEASTDCVVWSETDRLVALVGLTNVAIVDTEDALLVVNREHAQNVRRIVDQLKSAKRSGY